MRLDSVLLSIWTKFSLCSHCIQISLSLAMTVLTVILQVMESDLFWQCWWGHQCDAVVFVYKKRELQMYGLKQKWKSRNCMLHCGADFIGIGAWGHSRCVSITDLRKTLVIFYKCRWKKYCEMMGFSLTSVMKLKRNLLPLADKSWQQVLVGFWLYLFKGDICVYLYRSSTESRAGINTSIY